jgi:hypothetical protein
MLNYENTKLKKGKERREFLELQLYSLGAARLVSGNLKRAHHVIEYDCKTNLQCRSMTNLVLANRTSS